MPGWMPVRSRQAIPQCKSKKKGGLQTETDHLGSYQKKLSLFHTALVQDGIKNSNITMLKGLGKPRGSNKPGSYNHLTLVTCGVLSHCRTVRAENDSIKVVSKVTQPTTQCASLAVPVTDNVLEEYKDQTEQDPRFCQVLRERNGWTHWPRKNVSLTQVILSCPDALLPLRRSTLTEWGQTHSTHSFKCQSQAASMGKVMAMANYLGIFLSQFLPFKRPLKSLSRGQHKEM